MKLARATTAGVRKAKIAYLRHKFQSGSAGLERLEEAAKAELQVLPEVGDLGLVAASGGRAPRLYLVHDIDLLPVFGVGYVMV